MLNLSEHHDNGTPGAVIFVPVKHIDALHQELMAKNYK